MPRIFVIVLDSLGVGAMADAQAYGDGGANTLAHISGATGHTEPAGAGVRSPVPPARHPGTGGFYRAGHPHA